VGYITTFFTVDMSTHFRTTILYQNSGLYSAISVELYYIFATLWGREQYTLYGILFVVYAILLSVTACISVALTYFQLSVEDYRWWWRSIFSAGYVFAQSLLATDMKTI